MDKVAVTDKPAPSTAAPDSQPKDTEAADKPAHSPEQRRSSNGRPDRPPLTMSGVRSLLPLLGQHRGALFAAAGLSLVGALISLAQPLLVSRVISTVQQGSRLGGAVVLLVVLLIVGSLLGAFRQYLLGRTAEGVILTTRTTLVARLLRLPIAEYDQRRTGDLMARVSTDTTLLRAVVSGGLVDAASSFLTIVGAIVAMLLVDGWMLLVTLASVSVGVGASAAVARRVRGLSLASQERVGEMSAAVERALSAVRTIRVAGATEREADAVVRSAQSAYEAGRRAAKVEATAWPLVGFAIQGAFIAVLGVGGYRVASGAIAVSDLVAFILYLFLLVMPLGQMLNAFTQLQMGLGALTRIDEVLALDPEDDQPRPVPPRRADAALLEFDRVSFEYANGTAVLHDVSFEVRPGTTTALVGPSGAGKSTLMALAARFYDASSGTLRFDGLDVAGLSRTAVRERLGYVEQEAPVLAGSLRDNLTLAAPDVTEAEIRAVLAEVRLLDLVDRDPLGLEAQVGEGGVLLSGGERQRLAIARALLARPDLLLLDEPTASLDARNEAALRAALREVGDTTTVLVIAHRLSTVVEADAIVVLDQGRVVGIGTHRELLANTPLYQELARTQLLA